MRYFSALFLAFTVLCCSIVTGCTASVAAPQGAMVSAQELDWATVGLVRSQENDVGDPYVFCAGTWIGLHTILTAAHCADWDPGDAPRFATYAEAGDVEKPVLSTHALSVVKRDTTLDLALLHVAFPPAHVTLSVADFEPEVGAHVVVIGHPGGLVWSHYEGVVAAYRHLRGPDPIEGMFMQLQLPVYYGNSGGPAIDMEGHVVGVSSFLVTSIPDVAFYVDTGTIRSFCKGAVN